MCSLATGALSKCSCGEKIIVCLRVTEDPSAAGVKRGGRHAARDCLLTTMLCSFSKGLVEACLLERSGHDRFGRISHVYVCADPRASYRALRGAEPRGGRG